MKGFLIAVATLWVGVLFGAALAVVVLRPDQFQVTGSDGGRLVSDGWRQAGAGLGKEGLNANQLVPVGSGFEQGLTQASIETEGGRQVLEELNRQIDRLEMANETLRRQLSETNRDLTELQFQVDSHGESFRPLSELIERSGAREGASTREKDELPFLLPPR